MTGARQGYRTLPPGAAADLRVGRGGCGWRRGALGRLVCVPLLLLAGCGEGPEAQGGGQGVSGGQRTRQGSGPGGGTAFGDGAPGAAAAVPVEAVPVERRDISSYIETNGTLEAENEVDIVARASGPIVDLRAEEGMAVRQGEVLARLDEEEIRAQLEISRVNLKEARLTYERAQSLRDSQLISPEDYEQAQTRYETAQAQLEGDQILLGYTQVRAPFNGLIVARYVDFAEQVSPNTRLFRISDFDPLLCPIQVPERDLPKLRLGQRAYLTFEAFPAKRFEARVLRISPVVDAATGTVKVTLEVEAQGRLRPGMFARVFLETETRSGSLVIPKAALSLESLGDTVYVVDGGVARRREVELGFREGDRVEVLSGVAEGERVVTVGQDGLSDGTPIRVLGSGPADPDARMPTAEEDADGAPRGGPGGGRFDPSRMSPERIERARELLRARGLSEEEIEERLRRARERREGAEPERR